MRVSGPPPLKGLSHGTVREHVEHPPRGRSRRLIITPKVCRLQVRARRTFSGPAVEVTWNLHGMVIEEAMINLHPMNVHAEGDLSGPMDPVQSVQEENVLVGIDQDGNHSSPSNTLRPLAVPQMHMSKTFCQAAWTQSSRS